MFLLTGFTSLHLLKSPKPGNEHQLRYWYNIRIAALCNTKNVITSLKNVIGGSAGWLRELFFRVSASSDNKARGRMMIAIFCGTVAHTAVPATVSSGGNPADVPRVRPPLELQFSATMRISESSSVHGKVGDGCITARPLPDPVTSRVFFDAPNTRLAQTNAELKRDPPRAITQVDRFDLKPPTTFMIEPFFNESVCYEKPIGPVMCPNGTMGCKATFGGWGELCPFTSLFGMYYPNTTFIGIDQTTRDELWQFKDVTPTLVPAPNGTVVRVNITRNYTYHVAAASGRASSGELRALRRYEWTQGFPLAADPSTARFCAVFDYTQDYQRKPGVASFGPPRGVKCLPIARRDDMSQGRR